MQDYESAALSPKPVELLKQATEKHTDVYVRTLFMFRLTRHSINIVKTGENVPKFYKLVFNPNFHPIF
jgi:hypothetical protein